MIKTKNPKRPQKILFLEQFWVPFLLKSQSENILLFERLLEPVWSHLGKLLSCLGSLLGGLECYPGTTLQQFWHIFKNEGSQCRSCLERLLEAVLPHLDPCWGNLGPSWVIFGHLGAILGPKLAQGGPR